MKLFDPKTISLWPVGEKHRCVSEFTGKAWIWINDCLSQAAVLNPNRERWLFKTQRSGGQPERYPVTGDLICQAATPSKGHLCTKFPKNYYINKIFCNTVMESSMKPVRNQLET
jgi:hypothetical protein